MSKAIQADVYDEDAIEIFKALQKWHSERVEKLQSIVQASDDTEVQVRLPDGTHKKLEGEERKGFQSGIEIALMMLGKLPISIHDIEDEEQ